MALPFLQSYNDPKKEKAYRRYMAGETQRAICKALKVPKSTLALWSKRDGWEEERQARKIAAEAEPKAEAPQNVGPVGPSAEPVVQVESRMAGMERMLARQQRIVGRLLTAYEQDVERTMTEAEKTGKPVTRSQIHQLTTLGNNLLTMERKAWCVPDKIETKDTTPPAEDKVRKLKDEELRQRLESARAARLEAERRTGTAAARGGPETAGVN